MDNAYKGAFLQFDITPNVSPNNPALLQGMAGPARQSIAVALPLSLEMCLLEDCHFTKLLFVTADIIGFDQSTVEMVRRHAAQWGIDPEGIVLNASHTHYAPGTLSNMAAPLGPFYESYTEQIFNIISTNLQNLYNRLEPCNIHRGKARARIGVNRRYLKDNQVLFAPNPQGAYIEDTPFIKIDLLTTKKTILWVNHGCHPTGMGTDTRISSDYPGYLKYALKHDGIADGVMFFQGAGGSSKEAQKSDGGWIFSCSVGDVCKNGYKLSNIIKEALGKRLHSVEGDFYCRSKSVALPLKAGVNPSKSECPENERVIPSDLNQISKSQDLEIQLVSLSDDLNFLTFPSEPAAELAEKIQKISGFSDHDFLLGYTNGLHGYLPTDRMIEEGGYETEQSHLVYEKTAPLAPGTEKRVMASVNYLLDEKKQVEKDNGFGRYHKTTKPRKAFFVLSAGRCGTMTLAHLLNTATNANVWHHPQPDPIREALLAWWGKIDQSLTFRKARSSIIHKTWAQGLIHGETDLLMTPFAKMISEEIPESKFVILVRDPRAFVRSGMRRNYYKGHPWDIGRLRPDESSAEYAKWALLSQFEKICWLWNETYQRILSMTKDLPEDRKRIVKFEKLLSDPEIIEDLFAFLGLEGFDKNNLTQILSKKYNAQQAGNFPFSRDWNDELKEQSEKLYGGLRNYFEYPEIEEFSSSAPQKKAAIEKKEKPNLLFLELLYQSTGGHLDHIVSALDGKYRVKYLKTIDMNEARKAVSWADIVWLEWANQMAVHATNSMPEIAQKKVVCRLHGYEVFANMPSKINWDRVDRLIFVANHKKDIFNQKFGLKPAHQIVIKNGVNLDKFSIASNKKNTKKLVLLGHLNFRKGLPILLHFYQQLLKHDPSYYLYVRGEFQDPRLEMAARTMIKELELEGKIEFVGWLKDLNSWLADKSHILSFSLEESFHYAIGNGMAAGLKPVIHAWKESREIWPNEFVFRNLDEFIALTQSGDFEPAKYRQLLIDHQLHGDRQVEQIDALLRDLLTAEKVQKHEQAFYLLKPFLSEMSPYIIDIGALNFDTANSKPFVQAGFNALLIEPNPRSYTRLRRQTEKLENVIVVPVAINRFDGETDFLMSEEPGHSRIPNSAWKARFSRPTQQTTVKCWTMETLLAHYPDFTAVDFVDIDAEGMDEVVLETLFRTKCKPKFIMIEHQKVPQRIREQKRLFDREKYSEFGNIGDSTIWKKVE